MEAIVCDVFDRSYKELTREQESQDDENVGAPETETSDNMFDKIAVLEAPKNSELSSEWIAT